MFAYGCAEYCQAEAFQRAFGALPRDCGFPFEPLPGVAPDCTEVWPLGPFPVEAVAMALAMAVLMLVEELAAEVLWDQVSFWTHGSERQSWPGVSPDACQLCHHSAEEEAE